MRLKLASATNRRQLRQTPYSRLVNLYPEELPEDPDAGFALLPTPGIEAFVTLGGVSRVNFSADGVLSGDIISVTPTGVKRTNSAGTVTTMTGGALSGSTAPVAICSSDTEVVFIDGGTAYILTSANSYTAITDPDLPGVSDCVHISGFFVYAQTNSGRIYWSRILDAGNIDGLSFATAEAKPDRIVGLYALRNTLFIFGTDTMEQYALTGQADLAAAFQKRQGADAQTGCVSRASICGLDNHVYFLGRDARAGGLMIMRTGDGSAPVRASNHTVEDTLNSLTAAQAAAVECWAYAESGHTFLMVDMGTATTYALDLSTGQWAERSTLNKARYRAGRGVAAFGGVYASDMLEGRLVRLSNDVLTDVGSEVRRIATATAPVVKPRIPFTRVELRAVMGQGPLSGQGSDPVCQVRWSDDGGRTWTPYKQASVGKQGNYNIRAIWRALGRAGSQARIFEFDYTDPVNTSFIEAVANE